MSIAPPPGLKKKFQVISNIPQSKSEKKLSNNDFRALLETSKPHAERDAEEKEVQSLRKGRDDTRKKKKNARAESYKKYMAKKALRQEVHKTKYRDRAQERREETNPDYQGVEEFEEVDIEKSKYLGGDVEHTHLVKGLDFALLSKRKEELEDGEEDRLEREYQDTQKKKELAAAAASAKSSMVFVSNLGRRIYHYAVENPLKPRTSIETFLPGRMMFEFDLDQNFGTSLPTTLMQSRADCPAAEDRLSGQVIGGITRKLGRIMSLLTHGSKYGRKGKKGAKKKKDKKKRKQSFDDDEDDEGASPLKDPLKPSPSKSDRGDDDNSDSDDSDDDGKEPARAIPMVDDDEDIFGDAGREYECDVEEAGGSGTAGLPKYFDNEDEDTIKQEKNEDMERAVAALKKEKDDQMKEEAMKEKKKQATAKEQDPNYIDEYTNCYPATYGGSGMSSGYVVDDNSDEDDPEPRAKRSWDTNPEAEFGQFDDDREENSGFKNKKGGKGNNQVKSRAQKEKDKAQKFERDFNKIEGMMKKRGAAKDDKKKKARSEKRQRILSGFKGK